MPVEMIGWIAPRVSSELIPPSGPPFDADIVAETARIHERAGFDRVLIGYFSDAPDGFLIGAHAASVTERLGFLLAHRPGFVAPPLAARKLATLDQLSGGRLAVHIIAGGSDADQAKDGDWTDHEARYRRAAEYIGLLRRTWTEPQPFDHDGEFYRTRGTWSEIRCRQRPAYPDLWRRRFGRGDPGPGPACRCLHAVGRTAEGDRRVHGTGAPRGGASWPRADLQPVDPPDPGGDRRRGLGPGPLDPRPRAAQPRRRAAAEAPEYRLATAAARRRARPSCTTPACGRRSPPRPARRETRRRWSAARKPSPRRCSNITSSAPPRLLIRGYDPRPDAVQYGEALIPRVRELVAQYDAVAEREVQAKGGGQRRHNLSLANPTCPSATTESNGNGYGIPRG